MNSPVEKLTPQSLVVEQLQAIHDVDQAPNLVMIHGWGAGSNIWRQWLPLLNQRCNILLIDLPGFGLNHSLAWPDTDALLNQLADSLPEQAILIGFSLGGMLATQLAARFPQRVKALITIASNTSYVERKNWPDAMPLETYQQFYQGIANNSGVTLKRFTGLQVKGAPEEKLLLKQLKTLLTEEVAKDEVLLASLDCLADIDNAEDLQRITVPTLFVFGEKDALVPVAVAKKMKAFSGKNIAVIDKAPHVPFISHSQQTWAVIETFLEENHHLPKQACINKRQMAQSFSRAACSYDSAAELQRHVGEKLLAKMSISQRGCIVDLGSGTGYFSEKLTTNNPDADVVGLDIAEGMLRYAREKCTRVSRWLCGDAENLPLADNSVDSIFSSLAVQWCENNTDLFQEIYRVLKPGGICWLATLGPSTLHELRRAWASVDDYVHVNHFCEKDELEQSWQQAGLVQKDFSEELMILEYPSLKDLTKELKALGAHNVNAGRPNGLMGKRRLQQLIDGYEQQRNEDDLLPASYQVWWITLQK